MLHSIMDIQPDMQLNKSFDDYTAISYLENVSGSRQKTI